MSETSETIDYRRHMQRALQSVMGSVLSQVAEEGLPGEHHFLIAVDTTHPGVDMPGFLKAQYPEEIRLLMQNWFEDLVVAADRFAVTLSFSGQAQRLVVPFDAVLSFVDPSVEFGLRFDRDDEDDEGPQDDPDKTDPPEGGPEKEEAEDAPSGTGEVVSLDKFRK